MSIGVNKVILALLVLTASVLVFTSSALPAQWVDPVCGAQACPLNLEGDGVGEYANLQTISSQDGKPIVVFNQMQGNTDRVVVRRLDQGLWSDSNGYSFLVDPTQRLHQLVLARAGSKTYLARNLSMRNARAVCERDFAFDIRLFSLNQNGLIGTGGVALCESPHELALASVAGAGNGDLYFAYSQIKHSEPSQETLVRRLRDDGARQDTYFVGASDALWFNNTFEPSLAMLNNNPYIAFAVEDSGRRKLWVKAVESNGGEPVGGGGDVAVPESGPLNIAGEQDAFDPSLASIGSRLYVAWNEGWANGKNSGRLYIKRYEQSRGGWVEPERNTLNRDRDRSISSAPSLANVGGTAYVAFSEVDVDGVTKLWVKQLKREGDQERWRTVGTSLNASPSHYAGTPEITDVGGTPYVVWGEEFDERRFTYVKALDTDEDGRADNLDNCPSDANSDQANLDSDIYGDICDTDIDGDQVLDGLDNCPMAANRNQRDTNQNGKGDVCEDDGDNDGVPDSLDAFPDDPYEHSDGDGDRVGDFRDNCVNAANPDQRDSNANGIGDVCDPTQPPQSEKAQILKDTKPPQLKLHFTTRHKRLLVNGRAIDQGGPSVLNVLLHLNPICKKKAKRMKRTNCRNVTKKLQPDDQGRFKLSLRLTGIRHRLSISAIDKAGNKTTKRYMVKKIFIKRRKKSHQTKSQIRIEVAYKSRRDR